MAETKETKTIQKAPEPAQKEEEKVEIDKKPAENKEKVSKGNIYADISKGIEYAIATPEQIKKKQEQERTTIKKKMFLEYWERSRGVISAVCEKVDISRKQFYKWKREDKEFTEALTKIGETRNDEIEDLLMGKVFIEKNLRAITYYLDRCHPKYKPTLKQEIIAGEFSWTKAIEKQKEEIKKIQEEYDNQQKKHNTGEATGPDKQGSDRNEPKDKGQEGNDGAVHGKQSPEILRGEENTPKPDIKSEAKGTK